MSVFQAIILAVVEGITEFLPVSSTGHMALTSAILGIEKNVFTKLFIEIITPLTMQLSTETTLGHTNLSLL